MPITVLLFLFSTIPIVIIFFITITVIKNTKNPPYKFFNSSVSKITFLLGVRLRFFGEINNSKCFVMINHTSPIDYLLCVLVAGIQPWTVVAGENLIKNKKTLEDKIVAWLLGYIIRDYSITIDRDDDKSGTEVIKRMKEEIQKKKIVVFPEGGRTKKDDLKNGTLLRNFHKANSTFKFAWKEGISIQPVVLDWPVIWRGKNNKSWGVHPCRINIYCFPIIEPDKYGSAEDYRDACWKIMSDKLKESKNVKRFLMKNSKKGSA